MTMKKGEELHRGCGVPQLPGNQGGTGQGGDEVQDTQSTQQKETDCGELVGYVDDGAYSYANKDPDVLSEVLTEKYKLLERWMNNNKLVINPDKTHLMVMAGRGIAAQRARVSMVAGAYTIKPTETETLLGGHIHQSLQWNQHIRDHNGSLIRQLTYRVNGLKRIARNSTFQTKLMIANGAVMSKMVYLITVWGGATQYLLKAVQTQQLIAARAVCGLQSSRWSRKKLLDRLDWMSVRQLVYYHTVLQVHKTLTTGHPRQLHASLPTDHPYFTRNAAAGNIRYGENMTSTKTFKYRAMAWYNPLPTDVKTGTIQTVKRKLKAWVKKNVPIDWG